MSPAEIQAALSHPLTTGLILSRIVVAASPMLVLAAGYALHRIDRVKAARAIQEHLDEVGKQFGTWSWH